MIPNSLDLLLLLHRVTGVLPSLRTAFHCKNVFVSFLAKCDCQTGTRVFVRSGTVNDDLLAFRDLTELGLRRTERNVDRGLDVLHVIRRLTA